MAKEQPVLGPDGEWRYPIGGGIAGKAKSAPPVEYDGDAGEKVDGRKKRSSVYTYAGQTVYSGWKSIAKGLGVSVTTARRYHEIYGLPVVRLIARRPFTTRGVIDDWVARLSGIERKVIRTIREGGYGEEWMPFDRRWKIMQEEMEAGGKQGKDDGDREGGASPPGESGGTTEGSG